MILISTVIGAAIALAGSLGVEALRAWQGRVASWREMQATTIAELQELLSTIKDEVAKGKPARNGEPSDQAPSEAELETFAPRTRARMLCSRLDDRELAKTISTFLANVKNKNEPWRTDQAKWLKDQVQFADYANDLGERLRAYRPKRGDVSNKRNC